MPETNWTWTLDELQRLPDDGNRYELVYGDLFVTPAPSVAHERLASELTRILVPYVSAEQLGRVYHPRAVIQALGSQTEPDLLVRPEPVQIPESWAEMPRPSLVVEILSDSTRRRDSGKKRAFYEDLGIPDYWIVDGERRGIISVGPKRADLLASDVLSWHPASAMHALVIDIPEYFRAALG